MKILINVSEEQMDMVRHSHRAIFCDVYRMMAEVIMKGKPLPQNATNGDVIKAMFPNTEHVDCCGDADNYLLDGNAFNTPKLTTFKSWWNAPYSIESDGTK